MRAPTPPGHLPAAVGCCLFLTFFASGCAQPHVAVGTRSLQLTPDERREARAVSHYARGLLTEYADGNRSIAALEHFQRAVDLDPGHHRLNAKLAASYLFHERFDRADAVLQSSVEAFPDSFLAWVDLAAAHQLAGDAEVAVDSFRRAALLDPARTAIHLALAEALFGLHRDAEAIEALDTGMAHAREPDHLRHFAYRLGLQFIDNEESTRSLACFRFVVRHAESQHAQIYFLMGQLYEGLNMEAEARESYGLAARESPPLPQAFVRLALLELEEDPEAAFAILSDAQLALPEDLLIPFAKGQMLFRLGRYREAIPAFSAVSKLVQKKPSLQLPSSFYLHYGGAFERLGDYEAAAGIFEEGLQRHPAAHEIQNYLAYMWAEQAQHLDRALALVNQALEHEPANAAYLDTLGWIRYQQGGYADALESIQSAHRLLPDDPTITDHLGDVWSALGEREKAIAAWRASHQGDPTNTAVADKLRANGVTPDAVVRGVPLEPAAAP